VSAFWIKFSANDLNYVDVPLNPTHSLTHSMLLGDHDIFHEMAPFPSVHLQSVQGADIFVAPVH